MRPAFRVAAVVLGVALAAPALGQITPGEPGTYPSVSIVDSPHNINFYLSANGGGTLPEMQVCLPCHVPHNALLSGEENVLWNHAETTQTFTMYFSGTAQPEGVSKKCLSCHDGVTAIDSYGGTTGTITLEGDANLGTDLSNDHPIGIQYPTDRPLEYNDPSTWADGVGGQPGVQLVPVDSVLQVECTSCHNPHNNGLGNFLRVPLIESYICLECHIK